MRPGVIPSELPVVTRLTRRGKHDAARETALDDAYERIRGELLAQPVKTIATCSQAQLPEGA